MERTAYQQIVELGQQREAEEETTAYLVEHMRRFIKPGDNVLVCTEKEDRGDLSRLMEQAVAKCGGSCIRWGQDRRWKQLLRVAFTSRATTIIGSPLVIMGLSKLQKAMQTPLYIRNAVIAGYPCFDWIIDGIIKGFDCHAWTCFGLDVSGVVAGFSCHRSHGVHLRSAKYDLEIVSDAGDVPPAGQIGRWRLSPKGHPELKCCPGGFGRLERNPCPCGDPAPRAMDLCPVEAEDVELSNLAQYLLSWTSVLDFTLHRGPYGLEIELIYFPGEQLPTLPPCARQVVRPWDPETDEPFPYVPGRNSTGNFRESH